MCAILYKYIIQRNDGNIKSRMLHRELPGGERQRAERSFLLPERPPKRRRQVDADGVPPLQGKGIMLVPDRGYERTEKEW